MSGWVVARSCIVCRSSPSQFGFWASAASWVLFWVCMMFLICLFVSPVLVRASVCSSGCCFRIFCRASGVQEWFCRMFLATVWLGMSARWVSAVAGVAGFWAIQIASFMSPVFRACRVSSCKISSVVFSFCARLSVSWVGSSSMFCTVCAMLGF